MVASAAIGGGGLLAAGFGDATVKFVSMLRCRGDWAELAQVVRGIITINILLSTVLAGIVWILSPFAAHHVFKVEPPLREACVRALRVGAAILIVRSVESVFIGVLRAFEEYKVAVQITVISRAFTLITILGLVALGNGVAGIMGATLFIASCSLILQWLAVRVHVGRLSFTLFPPRAAMVGVVRFGCFSWLQAVSGVVFSQADRLILGAFVGTSAVGCYSICTQAAQPIHGLVAAGLHFLFPHLSARHSVVPVRALIPTVVTALVVNISLVSLLGVPVVLLSRVILSLWMGPAFAQQSWLVFALVAVGYGGLGLNVTGHYTLLALGNIKYLTCLNLAAGAVMLLVIALSIRRFGVLGAAAGRLVYGPVTWIMYFKIRQLVNRSVVVPKADSSASLSVPAAENGFARNVY